MFSEYAIILDPLASGNAVGQCSKKCHRCGPQPNSRLLLNYGFVDEDNPYDRLVIEVKSIPCI